MKTKKITTRPFSTQKLAKAFVLCIAIAWTLIAAFNIAKIFIGCPDKIVNVMKCIIVVIFCVAIIFLICIAWGKGRESDLTETHYVYKASGKDDLERVN